MTPWGWYCSRARRYRQWDPLGGHLDFSDASLSDAVARELLEETGLVVTVHPEPIDVSISSYRCRTVGEPVDHLDVVFAAAVGDVVPMLVASEELIELGWFDARDLPEPLLPATAELIGLAIAISPQE